MLGLRKTTGNARKLPPDEEETRGLTPPSFAAWLEVACFTAARPGELDALRKTAIDYAAGEIAIVEQRNAKTRTFTLPKFGPYTLALVDPARETLLGLKRDELAVASPFVFFTTLRGTHYTPSSRTHHWNRVRAAAGLGHTTLYLATRHYFGWYATNVLELPPDVVAQQLGHKDGGKLVAQLHGHLEGRVARRRIRDAFAATGQVKPTTCRRRKHRVSGYCRPRDRPRRAFR
jgi:integrase